MFFRIALSHDSLRAYFQFNFNMVTHYGYSLTELDNMMPWEREIYATMLSNYIKEQKERMEREKRNR